MSGTERKLNTVHSVSGLSQQPFTVYVLDRSHGGSTGPLLSLDQSGGDWGVRCVWCAYVGFPFKFVISLGL